jgi:hypothetical protein
MSKPAQPYSLPPGQGWTYDIGVEMTAKVGKLGQGRRIAVTGRGFVADFESGGELRRSPRG